MSKNPNLHQHLSQNQLHSLNQRQLQSLNLNASQTTTITPSHNTQESVSPSQMLHSTFILTTLFMTTLSTLITLREKSPDASPSLMASLDLPEDQWNHGSWSLMISLPALLWISFLWEMKNIPFSLREEQTVLRLPSASWGLGTRILITEIINLDTYRLRAKRFQDGSSLLMTMDT